MGSFEIVVEPRVRRRRERRPLSERKQAAMLFRMWHGVRELVGEAERLGDGELVHFLSVAQMLIEEKTVGLVSGTAEFEGLETGLPN
jgi:hypothetical protein